MATDPEARASGNSGVIIAVVALVLVVGLAIALMSGRGNDDATTVVTPPSTSTTTVIEAPDAAPAPDVNVEVTPPAEGASSDAAESSAADAPAASAPAGSE